MTIQITPCGFDDWSRSYRDRLEPIIRYRYASRGKTTDEADDYIDEVCWEHPGIALRRLKTRLRA